MHASDPWLIAAMYLAVALMIGVTLLGSRLKPSTRSWIERYIFGPGQVLTVAALVVFAAVHAALEHDWWRTGFYLLGGIAWLGLSGMEARKKRRRDQAEANTTGTGNTQ